MENREATKRSYGWGAYEPVWRLSFVPPAIASVFNAPNPQSDVDDLEPPPPVSVEGAGVVVGISPVAEEAGVSTYTLVRKGVSAPSALLPWPCIRVRTSLPGASLPPLCSPFV